MAIAAIAFLAAVLDLTPRRRPDEEPELSAWRRIGREQPSPEPGCAEPTCAAEPIDLYCFEHEVYLPRRDADQRSSYGVLGALAAFALFWLAAEHTSSGPLYVAFAGALFGVIRLALRRLPLTRTVAQAAWVTAAVGVPLYVDAPDWLRRALVVAALAVGLGTWVVHVAVEVAGESALRDRRIVTVCVAALGSAAALLAAYGVASYVPAEVDWRPQAPGHLLTWALLGTVGGVLVLTMGAGLGKGRGNPQSNGRQLIPKPATPRPLEIPKPVLRPVSGRGVGLFVRPVQVCFLSTVRVGAHLVEKALNGARQGVHVLVTAVVTLVNLMWSSRLLVFRYLADAGTQWLRLLRAVVVALFGQGARSLRVTLLPLAAAVGAATALLAAARAQRDYLAGGPVDDAATAALWCAAALGATAVLWSAWSGVPAGAAMLSSGRTAGGVVALAFGCQAVGGWLLGLSGMLGYGPVRVGWVTGAATLAFGVFFVWSLRRSGTPSPDRHELTTKAA